MREAAVSISAIIREVAKTGGKDSPGSVGSADARSPSFTTQFALAV
jgi:hypothetical protein